jgi:hypothetical protein
MDTVIERPKQRSYSDADKAKALIALDLNGGNAKYTAQQLDIPRKTLSAWKDGAHINEDVASIRHNKTKDLADKFEELANLYIGQATLTVDSAKGTTAITGAGIAVDKMRLLRGESTQNIAVNNCVQIANQAYDLAVKLHAADPNEPLPTEEDKRTLYLQICEANGVQADVSLLDAEAGETLDK